MIVTETAAKLARDRKERLRRFAKAAEEHTQSKIKKTYVEVPPEPESVPEEAPQSVRPQYILSPIRTIQCVVADKAGLEIGDLLGQSKRPHIVKPRWVAMYMANKVALATATTIGRHFGRRDHSTVIHALDEMERLIKSDQDFANEMKALQVELEGMVTPRQEDLDRLHRRAIKAANVLALLEDGPKSMREICTALEVEIKHESIKKLLSGLVDQGVIIRSRNYLQCGNSFLYPVDRYEKALAVAA
jgi:hypothetical protein